MTEKPNTRRRTANVVDAEPKEPELSPEMQKFWATQAAKEREAERAKENRGATLRKLRELKARNEQAVVTDPANLDSMSPGERVEFEEKRVAELEKHARASMMRAQALRTDLARVTAQISAEQKRLTDHADAVKTAAVAGDPLPDAPPSKVPALEAARDDLQTKLAAAEREHARDERSSADRSRLNAARREAALVEATSLVNAKIAPLVEELRTLLAYAPGAHSFKIDGATLQLQIAAAEQAPVEQPRRVGSVQLEKLRALREQAKAEVAT